MCGNKATTILFLTFLTDYLLLVCFNRTAHNFDETCEQTFAHASPLIEAMKIIVIYFYKLFVDAQLIYSE